MRLSRALVARTAMLARKLAAGVFTAFVAPAITTKLLVHGRLEPGPAYVGSGAMHGASAPVDVMSVEPNRRIVAQWPSVTAVGAPRR
ncbi:MAG: hypothetical protein IT337_12920 [Thermomicrobiales bacterium]|nr:hypothetical protein [Thermomicrobiales bacterium]